MNNDNNNMKCPTSSFFCGMLLVFTVAWEFIKDTGSLSSGFRARWVSGYVRRRGFPVGALYEGLSG